MDAPFYLQLPADFDEKPPPRAPYACVSRRSRGRLFPEPPSATRTEFQRDRDRIIHSAAFRRLKNKTQVLIGRDGDYFRTRLTHSLEVSQVARSIARMLAVNEDLAETLALAHDLGHTPFGHAGEDALNEAMMPFGGFGHNEHSFRIVTQLESRYAGFDGLNLCWETLEGLVKHNGPLLPLRADRPRPESVLAFDAKWPLELDRHAGLEAQIAALADDIAYNTHDMDDGWRAHFFTAGELGDVPLIGPALHQTRKSWPDAPVARIVPEALRAAMGKLVLDVIATTRENLAQLNPGSPEDIYAAGRPMVQFSPAMAEDEKGLRDFLFSHMYRHSRVNRMTNKARRIVRELFAFFMQDPGCLPADWQERALQTEAAGGDTISARARLIADYIAGMTDRYAMTEHKRLLGIEWPD